MRNYFPRGSNNKDFILNYMVIDDKISIRYGDNRIEYITYSIQGEKEILNRMREQVMDSKRFFHDIKRKAEIFGKLLMDMVILLTMFVTTKIGIGLSFVPTTMGFITFPVIISFTIYKFSKYQKLWNDIRKNLLFLNNEDCLNGAIRNNKEVTIGLDDKLRNKISSSNKELPFSLNTIDNIGYRELKYIYNHVNGVIGMNKCPQKRMKKKN